MTAGPETTTRGNEESGLDSRDRLCRFEEQISPHLTSAYNLAKWLTRNHEDAEDLAQAAFMRAFSALDTLRADNAKPWLLTIVRNTCLTFLKRNRHSASAIRIEDQTEEPSEPSPDPEETLLLTCNREQVWRAVEQLPSNLREALVLRDMEGLSYKGIATTVGVPLGTVMSRVSRARERFQKGVLAAARPSVDR